MKNSVEKLVFDEYIRCNLFDRIRKNEGNCNIKKDVENNKFENCICVPLNIYIFTRSFFFLKKELEKCSCPVFGSDSSNQKAGYTVCDTLDLNGKSTSIPNLFILMGEAPTYSNTMEVFAILLCSYFGELSHQYNIGLEYPTCPRFSTMIDEIDAAYSGNNQNADELLCRIYFYICVCVRGIDTFTPYRLYKIFEGITKYSEESAINICNDIDEVVNYVKQGMPYIDIIRRCPQNYLACVCTFLRFLLDKLDVTCKFYPILEHFNTAFANSKTTNPLEITHLLQELKRILNS